jgi:proton glutamate symport protein
MIALLRRISLTQWIIISMIVGVGIGAAFPAESQHLKVISNIFLRLIKCIIVPIIFGTLVVGIAGHSDDLKAVGRLAFKSLVYFEIVTTLALAVGLLAVNIVKPGLGVTLPPPSSRVETARPQTVPEILEHVVPKSFFQAAAENDVLQVVTFAVIFGIALTQVSGKPKETMLNFCEGLSEVMFKFTGLVMKFAPLGIGAAMAVTVGHSGIGVLKNLGMLVFTLYGALIVFILVVLWPVALIARIPVLRFLKAVKEPAIIAFTTSGGTALSMSKLRPNVPILAACYSQQTARWLAMAWGVYPIVIDKPVGEFNLRNEIAKACTEASKLGFVDGKKDLLTVTAGLPFGMTGSTNVIRVISSAGPDHWTDVHTGETKLYAQQSQM